MFKLILIIAGLVFAFLGYRKTWYPSWAFLFNILISIYISIMTAPQVVDKIPYIRAHLGNFSYSAGILTAAVIIFVVVQFLSFRFLTAVYSISFPKVLNSIGAAVIGFITGAIIAGFFLFLVAMTPLSDYDYKAAKFLAQISPTPDKAGTVVRGSCNFIHNISSHAYPIGVDRQMEKILTDWQGPQPQAQQAKKPAHSDPNRVETAE